MDLKKRTHLAQVLLFSTWVGKAWIEQCNKVANYRINSQQDTSEESPSLPQNYSLILICMDLMIFHVISSFWRSFFVYIAKSYMQYKKRISIWGGRKSDDRNQRRGYINEIVKEANDTALQGQNYVVRSTSNKLWSYAMLIMSFFFKYDIGNRLHRIQLPRHKMYCLLSACRFRDQSCSSKY